MSTNESVKTNEENQELVGKETLLEKLFPNEADRPTTRWLHMQCKSRKIPFIRIGRLIWFDVAQVRQAIARRHTIQPRAAQGNG